MSINRFAVFPDEQHILCDASLDEIDDVMRYSLPTGDNRMIGRETLTLVLHGHSNVNIGITVYDMDRQASCRYALESIQGCTSANIEFALSFSQIPLLTLTKSMDIVSDGRSVLITHRNSPVW